jgi:hypothetical protein
VRFAHFGGDPVLARALPFFALRPTAASKMATPANKSLGAPTPPGVGLMMEETGAIWRLDLLNGSNLDR